MAEKEVKEQPVEEVQEQPVAEEKPAEPAEQAPVEEVEKTSKRKKKKAARKEKKTNRLKKRLFNPVDIKYQGPLSYRYLRIFAWIALAIGQLVLLNNIAHTLLHWYVIPQKTTNILSAFGSLSTPFFIIASFGLILSNQKNYKNVLSTYGAAFFGMGIGITLFYYRYINGMLVKLGLEETVVMDVIKGFLGDKVEINVFSDLFAFACFHFFLNYTPKKVFKGKWIYVFRAFFILPLAFVIASYVIKIRIGLYSIDVPFFIYPFLTTKSPIIFAVFCLAALWIKYRERLFIRLGATREEYNKFLKTKRNSLSFSIQLSLIFLSCIVLEITLFLFLLVYYMGFKGYPAEMFELVINSYQCGQSLLLVLAIPFIMLYSYTRGHKNKLIDLFIPIIGLGLIALIYVEGAYQLIIRVLGL